MALLGKLMDLTSGITLNGATTTTFPHSLAQAPDVSLPILRSMASATANNTLAAVGANASLGTVQCVQPSTAVAAPGVAFFDLLQWKIHSIIR